ncbi:MAG TPA: alpha/beta hydrolase-fold protein [Pirellula sp.]|nr:alpha/beta hydrolase-fold protein [Pirellula sp.]
MTSHPRFLGLALVLLVIVAPAYTQDTSKRREPLPQVRYELGNDSKKQANIPEGLLTGPFLFQSKIIENTVRKYWVSVPSQYEPKQPACVLVFQDGARAINPNGVLRVPQVLENLIAKKLIPVTIGIYITPGQRGAEFPDSIGTGNPDNRDREYDVLDDKYARMLIEEILPEVALKYNLTTDSKGRAIGGSSSGGICAFTVAWHRPDQFRNVISLIGSFTNIHGGHVYPQLVREAATKPIRVFLQDGVNDLRSPNDLDRDWHLQNQAMVAALSEKKYDMAHVFGEGSHSDDHGGAILPEMLQWIWRDYPGVISAPATKIVEQARQRKPERIEPFPNFDANSTISPMGTWKWENNNNRMRRTETLSIEGTRAVLVGNIRTSSNINGETQSSVAKIESAQIVGNKLIFDVEREFRDRKVKSTYQGIVTEKTIIGWNISEFNGTPRDTPWRADRVIDKPVALIGPIGEFENASDVGAVRKPGSASFDNTTQSYEIVGSGTNMWATKDEFHMVWKKLKGDFILDAQMKLVGEGVDKHRKLGWIIRKSLDTDSEYADSAVHGDGLTSLQFRRAQGGITEQVQSTVKSPNVIQLKRKGARISMAAARAGDALQSVDGIDLDLGDEVYVGLYVCSHNPDVLEKGVFSNVRITIPVP